MTIQCISSKKMPTRKKNNRINVNIVVFNLNTVRLTKSTIASFLDSEQTLQKSSGGQSSPHNDGQRCPQPRVFEHLCKKLLLTRHHWKRVQINLKQAFCAAFFNGYLLHCKEAAYKVPHKQGDNHLDAHTANHTTQHMLNTFNERLHYLSYPIIVFSSPLTINLLFTGALHNFERSECEHRLRHDFSHGGQGLSA